MEIFACDTCQHVDMVDGESKTATGQMICTQCRTGSWHHVFEYEVYDPTRHFNVINRSSGYDPNYGNVSFS